MTLSAAVSAPPESKSRFCTPRRFPRRHVVQDCSEDEDEESEDPKKRINEKGISQCCHSAPSRIRIDLPDPSSSTQDHHENDHRQKEKGAGDVCDSGKAFFTEKPCCEISHQTPPETRNGTGEQTQLSHVTLCSTLEGSVASRLPTDNDLSAADNVSSPTIVEAALEKSPTLLETHPTLPVEGPRPNDQVTGGQESRITAEPVDAAAASAVTQSQTLPAAKQNRSLSVVEHSGDGEVASLGIAGTDSDESAVVTTRPKRGCKRRRVLDVTSQNATKLKEATRDRPRAGITRRRGSTSRRLSDSPLQTIKEGVETAKDALPSRTKDTEADSKRHDRDSSQSGCDESETKSDLDSTHRRSRKQRRRLLATREDESVDAERLADIPVVWQGRSFTAYSIAGYVQYLWDLALGESKDLRTASNFPTNIILLRNVLPELKLHRFGEAINQTTLKGIKIRYPKHKHLARSIVEGAGSLRYRLGVSETTRWVYIGIHRCAEDPTHKERLERVYGRLNLIPIRIKQGEALPQDCMAFLPIFKETRPLSADLAKADSSDEEPMSRNARSAYSEWKKDAQMMRWMKAEHDKPSHGKTWWTVTSTSLDCDGFNDEFGVPAALGFDLKRIQMKIAEALRHLDTDLHRACQYGDDDLRQTAYTEEAGNDRWNALEASDIQFQYPDCQDLSSGLHDEHETDTVQGLPRDKDAVAAENHQSLTEPHAKEECKERAEERTEHSDPATVEFKIPRKKRKLELGSETSPCPSMCLESSPGSSQPIKDKEDVVQTTATLPSTDRSSPNSISQSKRLKRSREELECAIPASDTTTTTSGPLSTTPPMNSSNAVMSRECQVVARRKNGSIFFMESFRELSLDIIGRSLWWIFAIGHTSVTEHLLAYHGPTILWNLRRLRRPWSSVVTEVLEDYRSRAMEDPCLNSPETVERVNDFLTALKRNPEVRHRRLATLKFRGALSIRPSAPAEPPPRPAPSPPEETSPQADSNDDADYNRAICDIVGLRTALFYSKPRFHRMFHETRVTLCKCTRCRNKFKASVNSGDGRIIRDIESDSTSDTRSVRESPMQGDGGEGDPELVAELKSLAMDKMDDYVTGTRVLSGHSERTMLALRVLLEKCSGDQCEMSQYVRDQLEECINKWLVEKPTVDAPSDKPKRSRRDRAGHLNEGDVEELRRCFFDDEFFPMRSAHRLNWLVRKSLYSMCSDHDWIAPILIARNEKGRAVYAAAVIYKGDFVCEYKGIFYSQYGIARAKESDYTLLGKGSFMFYFCNPLTGTTSCIDATAENAHFGPARLINHSHRQPNLEATVVVPSDDSSHDRRARLIFFASRDIRIGEELLIDYGETKPETLRQNSWLYD